MLKKAGYNVLRRMEGTTAVEYAFILPMLLVLISGIIEFNLGMYASSVLEGATTRAAREGATGYTTSGVGRQTYITTLLKSYSGGLLNGNFITITSKSYASFADIGQPEPCITMLCGNGVAGTDYVDVNGNGVWDADQGIAGLGGAGDIVVYTATYAWPIFSPILTPFIGSHMTLTSSAVVKNEPYTPAAR